MILVLLVNYKWPHRTLPSTFSPQILTIPMIWLDTDWGHMPLHPSSACPMGIS